MVIVLDTNVLISSQLKKTGNEATILEHHRQGLFQIAVSEVIFQEYVRVLNYSHIHERLRWTSEQMIQFLADFRKVAVFVQVDEKEPISTDPNDDKFFHCAKTANADFLISGDEHHVLSIPTYGSTKVVSPKAFLDEISGEQQRAA